MHTIVDKKVKFCKNANIDLPNTAKKLPFKIQILGLALGSVWQLSCNAAMLRIRRYSISH